MSDRDQEAKPASASAAPRSESAGRYRGEVVFHYAFDIAYEMRREPLKLLLGQEVGPLVVDVDKRTPRDLFFHRPQMIRLPKSHWESPIGRHEVEGTLKIFPVGALSFAFRLPFAVSNLDELVHFHDLEVAYQAAKSLGEQALEELRPGLVRPAARLRDEEAYTIFCVAWPLPDLDDPDESAENWLNRNRRLVAGLLAQETSGAHLSRQQVHETTGRYLSYYGHDLIVVDWDAALLIDRPGEFRRTLEVIELANVQLAELEAYDRILDHAIQEAYHNLAARRLQRGSTIRRTLREFRIDMARLSDELQNTTKFFGEWWLARVYKNLYDRFHLGDWRGTVNAKLNTLDEMYAIHKQDQVNVWMVVLELSIVVLFILDLVFIVMVG